jgi:hypothetical protein
MSTKKTRYTVVVDGNVYLATDMLTEAICLHKLLPASRIMCGKHVVNCSCCKVQS